MSVTTEQADAYFAEHLDSAYWSAQDASRRAAALVMADRQIKAVAGSRECPGAVCEQAVWLLRNHDKQAAGRLVTSQSLDGLGSQSFENLGSRSGKYSGIAPAAELLLKALLRGMVKFGRG